LKITNTSKTTIKFTEVMEHIDKYEKTVMYTAIFSNFRALARFYIL